jgi:hypothetical protein
MIKLFKLPVLKHWSYLADLIVVIAGILIAFALNNWNEARKEVVQETKYLERIVADLAIDTTYYANRISQAEDAIEHLDQYIHEAYETQESIEEVKELFKHLRVNTDHLTTQNSTYRELTSAGMLNILRNEQLKTSIVDYYRISGELSTHIKEFNLVSTEYLIESSRVARNQLKFFSLSSTPYDDPKMFLDREWDFINDPSSDKFQAIEAMAFIYFYRNVEHLGYFQRLKSISTALNNTVNENLKERS